MCGQFSFFIDDKYDEVFWILSKLNEKYPDIDFNGGDIFPQGNAPVYTGNGNKLNVELFRWGFPAPDGSKKVVFNTRSENAPHSSFWAESFKERRCIIPSTGFYEWDKDKNRYHFTASAPMLYMAGIYKYFGNSPRFSILTTDANDSIKDIHHRMPVILTGDDRKSWLSGENTRIILNTKPILERKIV